MPILFLLIIVFLISGIVSDIIIHLTDHKAFGIFVLIVSLVGLIICSISTIDYYDQACSVPAKIYALNKTISERGFENSSEELITKLNTEITKARRLLDDKLNPFKELLMNNLKKWHIYIIWKI